MKKIRKERERKRYWKRAREWGEILAEREREREREREIVREELYGVWIKPAAQSMFKDRGGF